jgi:branched-chain amino acid aminotransferase
MTSPFVFLNGQFLPFAEAALPLHDAGFVSGATVVDNARTFRHKLFRWADHLARFRHDCHWCHVPLEMADEQLSAAAEELTDRNAKLLPPGGELQLVTFATPGPLGFYLGADTNGPPTIGMVTYPLPFARYRPFFTEGATLAVVGRHATLGETILPPTVKHRSRMHWHIADHRARALTGDPSALALLADDDAVTETSIANFLAAIDGGLVGPPDSMILDGISLRVTRELCGSLGISVIEAKLLPDLVLSRASEAMLTGTAFCIAGVRSLHVPWHSKAKSFDWPGPVLRKLLAAWSDLVGVDIEKQFTESQ